MSEDRSLVENVSGDEDKSLDEHLRRGLDAHPAVAARIVHRALHGKPRPALPALRWAAAGALLALFLLFNLLPRESPILPDPAPSLEPTVANELRISNEGGLVQVTTPAGVTLVLLPGDSP